MASPRSAAGDVLRGLIAVIFIGRLELRWFVGCRSVAAEQGGHGSDRHGFLSRAFLRLFGAFFSARLFAFY
jgi:hypothetical protein